MCFHRADKQHMAVDKVVPLKKGPKQTAEPTRPGNKSENFNYLLSQYFQILKTFFNSDEFSTLKCLLCRFYPWWKGMYQLLTRTELSHLERTWKASKSITFVNWCYVFHWVEKASGHFLYLWRYSKVKLQVSIFWLKSQKNV